MLSQILIYILRVIIFIVLIGLFGMEASTQIMYLFESISNFLYSLVPIFQSDGIFTLIIGLIIGISCLLLASLGVTYIFAKICGLFKKLDNLNKWQGILTIALICVICKLIGWYLFTHYRSKFDFDNIVTIEYVWATLAPAYLLYLYFNHLTKKYPEIFKKIGFYFSIEFLKDFIKRRKYYFSSQFPKDVINDIKIAKASLKAKKEAKEKLKEERKSNKNKEKIKNNPIDEANEKIKKAKEHKFAMIVLIIMIILQTILAIYAYYLQNITLTRNNCYNLTILIGYLICFILYKKIKKQKKVMFFSIFLSIALIIYCIFEKRYFYDDSLGECAHGYCSFVSSLGDETVAHFPETLPPNTTNYKYLYDWSFGGDGTDYARFNCNVEDIESIIKRSEENTKDIMRFSEFDDIDRLAHRFEIKDKEKYTIYIMKKPQDSGNYTSGIIASKEKKEIILFFARPQIDYKRIKQ